MTALSQSANKSNQTTAVFEPSVRQDELLSPLTIEVESPEPGPPFMAT